MKKLFFIKFSYRYKRRFGWSQWKYSTDCFEYDITNDLDMLYGSVVGRCRHLAQLSSVFADMSRGLEIYIDDMRTLL